MGCDIHASIEVRQDGQWAQDGEAFDIRNYGMFGFLAGVRNYSGVAAISQPRGIPEDASIGVRALVDLWGPDMHTPSWLSLRELQAFDYDAEMEDRRTTVQIGPNSWDGDATCPQGQGMRQSWRDFLPAVFFEDIERMAAMGAPDDVRVVFFFDN